MNSDNNPQTTYTNVKLNRIQHEFENEVLSNGAIKFLISLHESFGFEREKIIQQRQDIQNNLDDGWNPSFLNETIDIRESNWKAVKPPSALLDRRVEITGPVDRKMIINGMNSGANVFMADFEDSCSPTWNNIISGQKNLLDAVSGSISLEDKAKGKFYKLNDNPAVLIVRPRGLHLEEYHFQINQKSISASLFDFGIFFYHNAKTLSKSGLGPFFYIPKIESYKEARLWNKIIKFSENYLGLESGTTRVTVLIETILAGYQMNEIIFELKDYIAGLNCGRWDYIFSKIKKFKSRRDFIFPNRSLVTMDTKYLSLYSKLLIQTCHSRGIHAMGGMAAQIPIKDNPDANNLAINKVKLDKDREAKDGHDGTWVAHPGLVPIALKSFNNLMPEKNQIDKPLNFSLDDSVELMGTPPGEITYNGLEQNIQVGIKYIAAWLTGIGCVPINNLMEDAATAEISRAQIWQWIKHSAKTSEGEIISSELVNRIIKEKMYKTSKEQKQNVFLNQATELFREIVLSETFEEFLTIPAYTQLLSNENQKLLEPIK